MDLARRNFVIAKHADLIDVEALDETDTPRIAFRLPGDGRAK